MEQTKVNRCARRYILLLADFQKWIFYFFLLEIIITNATKHNMGHIWLNRPAVSVTFYIIYQFMAVYIGNKCQSVPVLDFLSL